MFNADDISKWRLLGCNSLMLSAVDKECCMVICWVLKASSVSFEETTRLYLGGCRRGWHLACPITERFAPMPYVDNCVKSNWKPPWFTSQRTKPQHAVGTIIQKPLGVFSDTPYIVCSYKNLMVQLYLEKDDSQGLSFHSKMPGRLKEN